MKREVTRYPLKSRRGVAAFELAIISPLILLFALVCVDYGRIIYTRLALTNAVNTGMAYATTHAYTDDTKPLWIQEIENVLIGKLSTLSTFDSDALSVSIDTTEESGNYYRVSIDAEYPFKTIVTWPGVPPTTNLKYHLEMKRIR